MEYTNNYNLAKPAENEYYDINILNQNADLIDTKIKEIDDTLPSFALDSKFKQHINDNINHITNDERNNWNDANNQKHSHLNNGVINSITQEMIDKINGVASGAEVNVQSDWNATNTESDTFIKNKPTKVSQFINDTGFITAKDVDTSKNHVHENKATLDKITQENLDLWGTVTNKADKVAGKDLSTNDYTDAEKGIVADVNSKKHTHTNKSVIDKVTQTMLDNWDSSVSHISDATKHIAASERIIWNDANSKKHEHINKAVIDKIQQADLDKLGRISDGAEVNVQPDWNVTDTASDAYIKNKPTSFTPSSHKHTKSEITDFPTSMPASDVSAWAKANTKPNYTWNEIQDKPVSFNPTDHTHTKSQITDMPTKVSQFENDAGYITAKDIDTSQNHIHSNKTVLDKITQGNLDSWNAIENKVDKISGKGLSTNDLTSTLKSNYDKAYTHSQGSHAPTNAERNVFIEIKKNGTAVMPDVNRAINITVPTKVGDLTNDVGYITAADIDSSQNHIHANKTVLDKITQESLDKWDSGSAEHIHEIADVNGLQTALNNKSDSEHNHDTKYQAKGNYASSSHNHNGVYQPVGNYAPESHSHPLQVVYSKDIEPSNPTVNMIWIGGD